MGLLEYILLALTSLFVIIDPIAVVPAFLGMTPYDSATDRVRMARLESLVAGCVLVFFVIVGEGLFKVLGITMSAFKIAGSIVLLLIAMPVFLLIAIAIKLESRGPVFYNAKRAGRGFKIFKFFKFRTMVVNADKKIETLAHLNQYGQGNNGAKFFKIANDPRITKVGKFLRNTSLDELPQLFNVLKGDMSLVGNRPLPLYEAATLTTNEFVERFMAPAGITGLWQIKKRGRSEMSIDERIGLDISYARQANLLYDFWIMARTPAALLQKTDV